MKKIAIKGHATRGSEVIELLEMLGGRNKRHYKADNDDNCYFINKTEINHIHKSYLDNRFIGYTLEEFLEKFPYKVGDKVRLNEEAQKRIYEVSGFKRCLLKEVYEVTNMFWIDDLEDLRYRLKEVYEVTNMFWIDDLEDLRYRLKSIDSGLTFLSAEAKEIIPLIEKDVDAHCYADFNVAAYEAYSNAIKRNRTEVTPNHEKDVLGLLEEFTEFSKASEDKPSEHLPEYTEAAEELADILIGCLTELYKRNVDVGSIIRDKINYNETREA